MALLQKGIALYREIRENIPAFVPFYPFGIPQYGEKWFCTGYRGKKTYLAVWRIGGEDSAFIPMKNGVFTIKDLLPDERTEISWSEEGIYIKMNAVPFATILSVVEKK